MCSHIAGSILPLQLTMLLCLMLLWVGFSPSCRRLASLRNTDGCLGVTAIAGDSNAPPPPPPPPSEPVAAADDEDGPEESGSKSDGPPAGGGLPGIENRTEGWGWIAAACACVVAGSPPDKGVSKQVSK